MPCCPSETAENLPTPSRQEIPTKIVEEDYSPASSRSFFKVGLYLFCLSFRFLLTGSARVGGGVPIAWRAAALTADAARNGFDLGILEGTSTPPKGLQSTSIPAFVTVDRSPSHNPSQSIDESRLLRSAGYLESGTDFRSLRLSGIGKSRDAMVLPNTYDGSGAGASKRIGHGTRDKSCWV